MFTGIVTDVGEALSIAERADGLRTLTIGSAYNPASIAIGASIACSGICLTVVETGHTGGQGTFTVDAAAETLSVTTAKRWQRGTRLNLERALKVGDELGGHIVTGHVDGVGEVMSRDDLPEMAEIAFRVPRQLARFIAAKGSIAVDGASLTVNTVTDDSFSVLLIPHTLKVTTLGELRPGMAVNVEVDLMARYAARLMEKS
ncbi:MAG TPA: riboflavin synthase [Xanthobacteraceae bacterium]|jgi:riboflavin synthase|nr:riboflavin synthase [Xanthobacteraceae bacterium]